MHFRHRKNWHCWHLDSPESLEWHHVSSALTQQRVLFAWPCCLLLIKVCKQLTDMCVRLHACLVNVRGGQRFPYGSLGKALFDQHAWLAQIVQSESHKQWHFLMLPSAYMASHLEIKHTSLNRVPLITLSQPLLQLCQQFLTGKCVHAKTMFDSQATVDSCQLVGLLNSITGDEWRADLYSQKTV